MSVATKTALFGVLQTDATLTGMLALDPHPNAGGRKAIFGAWRGNTPKALPQLIVRQADSRPDPDPGLSRGVFHEMWHFQSWAQTTSDVHSQIIERVEHLLHEKRFALGAGLNLKYLWLVSSVPDGWDDQLKESFALQVYELVFSNNSV